MCTHCKECVRASTDWHRVRIKYRMTTSFQAFRRTIEANVPIDLRARFHFELMRCQKIYRFEWKCAVPLFCQIETNKPSKKINKKTANVLLTLCLLPSHWQLANSWLRIVVASRHIEPTVGHVYQSMYYIMFDLRHCCLISDNVFDK